MNAWIDIDNAPHVQIFRPVIARLRERGAEVSVTARDRTYVPQLLERAGIEHTIIGKGQPAGAVAKLAALGSRAAALVRFARGKRFDVAAGHGSRTLPIASRMSGVPNLTMFDYEHVSTLLFRRFCDRILIPRIVVERADGTLPAGPWVPYDGFKEELYLGAAAEDPDARGRLGVGPSEVLAVVRPPSRTAHYHDRGSETLLDALVARLATTNGVRTVWLRRDPSDCLPTAVHGDAFIVPDAPLDGPSLAASADLVVSGGGTMIREAALLGTPAYSIFTGPVGAVDAELVRSGRLVLIRAPGDLERIRFERRTGAPRQQAGTALLDFVVGQIEGLARTGAREGSLGWAFRSSI